MGALQRLFTKGHSKPVLTDKVEIAVNDVLREAEELCRLLRKQRQNRDASAPPQSVRTAE